MIAHGPNRGRTGSRTLKQPVAPMEAHLVDRVPIGANWQYEPKWDGFRCIAFRDGDSVELQSKAGQPLARYFPDIVEALRAIKAKSFVLDGEIVVPINSDFSFDHLLQRIHPAKSRVEQLARQTPAMFIAFDLLRDDRGHELVERPLAHRRARLEAFASRAFEPKGSIRLSPATRQVVKARRWFRAARGGGGIDGIVAKDVTMRYCAGERTCMRKVKHARTAECVVGGFRMAGGKRALGSLLLGLYDRAGILHHVGFTSSFTNDQRSSLLPKLERLKQSPAAGGGFSGKAPGGPSRWSSKRSTQWVAVAPRLVVEVQWNHFTGERFRHGTRFLRWRPDKNPRDCTMDQVKATGWSALRLLD